MPTRIDSSMDREARERLRAAAAAGERLAPVAARVRAHRAATRGQARRAADALGRRVVRVRPPGEPGWQVLALGDDDAVPLGELAADRALTPVTTEGEELLSFLDEEVPGLLRRARALLGVRRFLTLPARRDEARAAADLLLRDEREWASPATDAWLERLDAQGREPALPLALTSALDPAVGLRPLLTGATRDHPHRTVAHERVVALPDGAAGDLAKVRAVGTVIIRAQQARDAAVGAGDAVRGAAADLLLSGMPVDRLREATGERLRIGALREAGITTVGQVLDRSGDLTGLPGVGAVTARRMLGAAQALRTLALQDAVVRPDPHRRFPEVAALLRALHTWEVLRQAARAGDVVARAQALEAVAAAVRTGATRTTHLAVVGDTPEATAPELLRLRDEVLGAADQLAAEMEGATGTDPWADFLDRPAVYFSLLSELGLIEETGTYGDVPDDVVEAVREQELDATHLRVSLRGYQAFAARFALVQRKVIIGDEMGLGKTVEALAVLAHRVSDGGRWFLVVCPAAVISSWVREIADKTALAPRRLHGADREEELGRWRAEGGVAVTSYSTLAGLWDELDGFEVDALVVDEAHYVKNPGAGRSRRVAALVRRTEHVMLLTGTPMENRVSEFATLVGYLRPDLLGGGGRDGDGGDGDGLRDHLGPVEFRARVAPVYLRRNTEDVLVELPDLVEVQEWLEFTDVDRAAYREAVEQGRFMAMRQAAFRAGAASAKGERLIEIVEEAEENGRRVLVFSYFRDVLEQVAAMLPGRVFGPLTGSVAPDERQRVVDEFSRTADGGGSVLVAQIQAVGVGLNIQAASVVVLCEPQLKPTTEWQAIARARRMGQLESVQVHRLLAEDSVDERLVELLSGKSRTFDSFARVSETAQNAPEAYDLSEADLVRRVLAAEQERLLGAP
ncbi:DEAD/DEAH box helicase [Ornithinimicrobium sp. LYQ92]|uniref:DEAD/DEAH box helicase n=1 Tax=Serinicoccus sp. LYQ92 TaxID=3378798 RepID=UPI0038525922